VGYGQTGNQEFNPVDAALSVGIYNGYIDLFSHTIFRIPVLFKQMPPGYLAEYIYCD